MEVTPLSQVKDLVKDDLLVNLKNKATSIKLDNKIFHDSLETAKGRL